MYGRVVRADGKGDPGAEDDEELDQKRRYQYQVILQYLQEHELVETLVAFERETGVKYGEDLPVASVLEATLDMFSGYMKKADAPVLAEEDELWQEGAGVCCTAQSGGLAEPMACNVTAVCWAASSPDDMVSLAATADKRVFVLDSDASVLACCSSLSSPVLSLDALPSGGEQLVLATCMGGEVYLLLLRRPAADASGSSWSLESSQRFKDHTKHATSGRFAVPTSDGAAEDAACSFLTVSRDHTANVYSRAAGSCEFLLVGTVRLGGEVTCCAWIGETSFLLAARDDHQLHYWDMPTTASGTTAPTERTKANMNALGDSVVSFTVLALAVSPDRAVIAACTDKSRVIVMRTFTNTQVRNLYGAVVDEYDVPSLCFSLDGTFLYTTSSLPQTAARSLEEEVANIAMCGQVAIFDLQTSALVLKLPCHTKPVRCMHRHPCTEALVTGSFDKTVKFWS